MLPLVTCGMIDLVVAERQAIFTAKGCSFPRGCWCMFYRESGKPNVPYEGTYCTFCVLLFFTFPRVAGLTLCVRQVKRGRLYNIPECRTLGRNITMNELILHHYPGSHFAEKVRRILAYKDIPWRGVEQPFMMPKPDLVPLTGGNRRIPVLQIGADIYCDTVCIVRRIEQLHPEPTCIPPSQAGVIRLIEEWAGHRLMFQVLLPTFVEIMPALPPEFMVDRAAMSPGLSKEAVIQGAPHALSQALLSFDHLDSQLRDRSFLLGETFTLADAACFFAMWLFKNSPKLFATITDRPALAAWFTRIEEFGPGKVQPLPAAEALAIAREAKPADIAGGKLTTVDGLSLGNTVAITADDYGVEESRGTVVRLAADEIVIQRSDPTVGEVAVHFPRSGYRIVKQ